MFWNKKKPKKEEEGFVEITLKNKGDLKTIGGNYDGAVKHYKKLIKDFKNPRKKYIELNNSIILKKEIVRIGVFKR